MSLSVEELTPRQIVAELDKYIVGQDEAKRAVAVALRNRYRRQQLPPEDRRDIMPKNILMMGPTGVGKTEIARRLAQLSRAPFVKVEATKFTEVGYVGRDVESMVRDLGANAVRLVEQEHAAAVHDAAFAAAIDRILDSLWEEPEDMPQHPGMASALGVFGSMSEPHAEEEMSEEDREVAEKAWEEAQAKREEAREKLRQEIIDGVYDSKEVEVEVEEPEGNQFLQVFTPQGMEEMGIDMNQMMGKGGGTKVGYRRLKVKEAKESLTELEAMRRIDRANVNREALERAEQVGIIFIDEIDKVAMKGGGSGPEVSREGVQRDLLPIVEGSSVASKFGSIRTDHILFIAAGAFHESKPSDLIPELQGRLPIRVRLQSLDNADFIRILTEPKNALTKQYQMLLGVDGVELEFGEGALEEVARLAMDVNAKTEDIGARRLHTMLERLLEDFLYDAPEAAKGKITIDAAFVREELGQLVKDSTKSNALI